jgi:hypothetical protein
VPVVLVVVAALPGLVPDCREGSSDFWAVRGEPVGAGSGDQAACYAAVGSSMAYRVSDAGRPAWSVEAWSVEAWSVEAWSVVSLVSVMASAVVAEA